jgi:hypothetical protein
MDVVIGPLEQLVEQADYLADSGRIFHSMAICLPILERIHEIDLHSLSESEPQSVVDDIGYCFKRIALQSDPTEKELLKQQYEQFLSTVTDENCYRDSFFRIGAYLE